ncbi:Vascular endothelial growth factor receptor 3 [Orchesella cincta]|uniref:Vascular endothelial growth factor receptor 3 n=1 Tax=Orchesella cincta TaxID=48709 RepID=A0A1D2MY79_ORCCI|nr:Vascular endothelial growth factor receptor 3 [Orchesella cincta]
MMTRNIKSSNPIIRVVDEINEEPGVILGQEGLQYYTLISSRIQREVVIECSNSHGPVKWLYKGAGASSGFKIVNTRWTVGDINRAPSCFSTALVISNVTDQLTGEYKCLEVNSTRAKGPKRNSFKLFVPSIPPTYPEQGSEINVTVPNSEGKQSRRPVILPCISKKMNGEMILYKLIENSDELQPIEYANMRYDFFSGFVIPQSSIAFENSSRILRHECRFVGSNSTLLRVNLVLESGKMCFCYKPIFEEKKRCELNGMLFSFLEEKIAPEKDEVKSSSPYLSWTTNKNPKLRFTPDIASNVLTWQQFYTKKGYEEISEDAPMFYLGSATLVNLTEGKNGEVDLYDGKISAEDGLIYKWKYYVLDALAEQNAGMKYEDFEYFHVFICKSASNIKPKITLKEIKNDDEASSTTVRNVRKSISLRQQGRIYGKAGCVMLTSYINQGEVRCVGDGVDETIRYPPLPFEAGRPFFVERGSEILVNLPPESEKLRLPCVSNSEIATSVFLYKRMNGEFKKIWSEDDEEFGDSDIEFYPSSGFHLSQSNSKETQTLYGEYMCSSSTDMNDHSDSVTVFVKEQISINYKLQPAEKHVFGQIPYKFSWEADEELEIVPTSTPARNMTFGRGDNDSKYGFGGKLIVLEATPEGGTRNDCYPSFYHEDASNTSLVDNCSNESGCNAILIRGLYLNGILNVSCSGEGVYEYRMLKDDDIVWNIGKSDDDYIHLSTSHAVHTADQNPQREIQFIGANVEFEMGETVEFSCVAAPFLFANGIKWALETKKGKLVYQKDSIFDVQFKYIGSTQVASTFSLLIDSNDYSRVYCFVPMLGSPTEWRNASMPIFVRSEMSDLAVSVVILQTTDDYCHETNSIHLINIYPSPSKLNLELNETRLDKLPYFIVPKNVLQFAVKVSGPKPFYWSFTGNGDGPSRTPLIQSDRQVLDFYDSSTYCYSSRLLLNLRHKTPNDTGRYVVKQKHESREIASFYLFVPTENPPYLLRSGSTVNVTVQENSKTFYVPCLVNNPDVKVELQRMDNMDEVSTMNASRNETLYDPTRGFLVENDAAEIDNSTVRTYKCIANGNQEDYLIVYVNPPVRNPELKYEKVNDFHVFTCRSATQNPPEITLTEIAKDGTQVENATEFKTTRCAAGCVALITQINQGSVSCIGDDIDETYRFPPSYNANRRNSDKSVGLWYDNVTETFKCQTNSMEPPTLAAVTCRRPNECEIMKRLLQEKGDQSQATYSTCGEGCAQLEVKVREKSHTAPNWFSVFLRCKGEDNMEILSQYFYDKNKMTYASIENAEQLKKIRIDIPGLRRQGNQVFATFRCFANRYFYSRGLQWALEGKNGILEFPATSAAQFEVQNFSAVMSTIDLEINENTHSAVYCFVPLLDSAAWANSTIKFPIEQLQINL